MPLSFEKNEIQSHISTTLSTSIAELGPCLQQGKVREIVAFGEENLLFLATDRISAFDKIFTSVPFKGQVLTQVTEFWLTLLTQEHPEIPHHYVACPDPNFLIVKKLRMLPIEFIVRGYATGSTHTSLWKEYLGGKRRFGGIELPDDLCKNSSLPQPILTPTTKSNHGDQNITEEEILEQNLLTPQQWQTCKTYCMQLFAWGTATAKKRGLVLVDTKYEFGLDTKGQITLADEVHTPDSSRYWSLQDVQPAFTQDRDPHSWDKEWFRTWLLSKGNPYDKDFSPNIPPEIICKISENYLHLYERILQVKWENFVPPTAARILKNFESFKNQQIGK